MDEENKQEEVIENQEEINDEQNNDIEQPQQETIIEQQEIVQEEPAKKKEKFKITFNHLWFFKPFKSVLAQQDGKLVGYYSICFCILFGLMFGDVGQGLLLVLLGIIFSKEDKIAIFSRLGIFSTLFGWLYGSLFGNEEIIGVWMRKHHFSYKSFALLDRENTETLLLAVVAIGIIMLIGAILINIISKVKNKQVREIFSSSNCLAALLFYVMISLLSIQVLFKIQGAVIAIIVLVLMIICLLLLLKSGGAKNIAVSILRYVSAIMSFLQVGCYALAYAFLMHIVCYVASTVGTVGVVVIAFGNLIVMAIEATEVWHKCYELILSLLQSFIVENNNN